MKARQEERAETQEAWVVIGVRGEVQGQGLARVRGWCKAPHTLWVADVPRWWIWLNSHAAPVHTEGPPGYGA